MRGQFRRHIGCSGEGERSAVGLGPVAGSADVGGHLVTTAVSLEASCIGRPTILVGRVEIDPEGRVGGTGQGHENEGGNADWTFHRALLAAC